MVHKLSAKQISLIVIILSTLFLGAAGQALATDTEDFEKQLALLKKQIVDAQVKIARQNGRSGIPPDFVFTGGLKIGDYGQEIVNLQLILKEEGFFCKKCFVTGYFGQGTRQGVAAFQQKYADEILTLQGLSKGSGVVDDLTLAKLNKLLKKNAALPAGACVLLSPSAPSLSLPADNAISLPLSFDLAWGPPSSWGRGCPDNKGYRLQLDDNSDFSSPLINVLLPLNQLSYEVSPGLLSGDMIYHWRLRAENGSLAGDYALRRFGVSFSPALNLRVNDSRGPITVNYNNSVTLSWNTADSTSCLASGDWSGDKGVSGSEIIKNLTSSKKFKLTCAGLGGSDEAMVEVEVLPLPTLFLDLKAALDGQAWQEGLAGQIPLNGADVSLVVSGNTVGPITYKLDCASDGIWDKVFPKASEDSIIISDICDYSVLGTYLLWARAERGGLAAEKSLTVSAFAVPVLDWQVLSIDRNPKTSLKAGDSVVYAAKVVNRGPASIQEFKYYWLADYISQVSGRLPGLKAGETATVFYRTTFPAAPKKIEFLLDPNNEILEASKSNNSLTIGSGD
ncbi:MAG: CARDB domain-containing protein [bacterium]|nr:CARDB domain-containing protein [bacterium]